MALLYVNRHCALVCSAVAAVLDLVMAQVKRVSLPASGQSEHRALDFVPPFSNNDRPQFNGN